MRHFILPDVQAKLGHDFTFLTNIGRYIVAKKPEKIICLGDFADLPSLSSYDVGKKSHEGKRYATDVAATKEAMAALMAPLKAFNAKAKKNKEKLYKPQLHMTLGNHEDRINRAINNDAKLDGIMSIADLGYSSWSWNVYPFLDVVVLDGVAYSHYFTTGLMGRPASSAQIQLAKKHQSCIAGHQQGLQIATAYRADGKRITSVIAGSCYEHNEDYMSSQGNQHYRGALMLYDVKDGEFNLVPVPLSYINGKFGNE